MKAKLFESNILFYTIITIFFIVFFSRIHPIVPYDTDDWQNICIERPLYPSLECRNPTKVFPECFEPAIATLAGYLVVPLVGDYIDGLILTNAFVVSLFILVYLISVHKYLKYRFKISQLTSFALIIIFILLHFYILRYAFQNNEHLWYSHDANCYYHYVIPNMMCASMVLWLMRHDVKEIRNIFAIIISVVLTYLALCSNLYSVVILIAYIGAVLLMDLFHHFKAEEKWLQIYIKRNSIFLVILVLWSIVQIIEANGMRATGFGYLHQPFVYCMKVTVYNFLTTRFNHMFILVTVLILMIAKFIDVKKGRNSLWNIDKQDWVIILALGLSTIYLIMLSSRVNPTYIQRGDVVFEYVFFYLLLVILAIAYICTHVKYAIPFIPLFLCFIYFETKTSGNTFKDVMYDYEPDLQTCIEIDRDIVRKICNADALGQDSVIIGVPRYSKHSYNWPIMVTDYASQNYGKALYKHNQTKREIKTIFIPTYIIDE